MKKKTTLAITLVALVAVAIIGGTLAWFTDSASVTNKIKTGKVDISLTEDKFVATSDNNGNMIKDTVVVPGTSFAKNPTIKNEGNVTVKVRYKVTAEVTDMEGKALDPVLDVTGLTYSKSKPLTEGQNEPTFDSIAYSSLTEWQYTTLDASKSLTIFDFVNMPNTWGNTYQEKMLNIKVEVQALQNEGTTNETWETVNDFKTGAVKPN